MSFFFFNDTATTEIYTLSLHDALPISKLPADLLHADDAPLVDEGRVAGDDEEGPEARQGRDDVLDDPVGQIFLLRIPDRKSTRLNSSHANISYAVFCLKKKKRLFL